MAASFAPNVFWSKRGKIGRTRFERLYLIGTSSSYLYLEALKAAITEAKKGKDVARYEQAVSALKLIAPDDPDASSDTAWIKRTNDIVKVETDRLELELKGYKNNLIKESIRVRFPISWSVQLSMLKYA